MGYFRLTCQGWLRGTPSYETLEWARRVEAEGDKTKPNEMHNFSERRYQGFVAERAFDRWLGTKQVSHIWNGETDPLPDFELGSIGVGVKSCGSKSRWKSHLVVNVDERHREHSPQELFFVGFEHPGAVKRDRPTVVLLGGLPSATYFERATLVEAGGQLNPITTAENNVWNLETSELQPPHEWLVRIRRQMSTTA